MHKIDWNDLKYILAVARAGSLAAGARALGVNHSTVLRRVNAFEEFHAVRLFDRSRTGYALTSEGEQLLKAARDIDDVVTRLERKIDGKDLKLEGRVRLTTTDTLLYAVVMPHLVDFQKRYPDISVEVTVTNSILNLTRRDADVAVRPSPAYPDHLVGENVGLIHFALYCSREYWAEHSGLALREHTWLGPDEALAGSPPGRWMRQMLEDVPQVFSSDTYLAIYEAVRRGIGMAVLPCVVERPEHHMVRLALPGPGLSNSLWVLTHKDLEKTARVRTFMSFFAERLRNDTARLERDLVPDRIDGLFDAQS